ncbi:hypothetical protein BD310DRAFT_652146 [Dichomitus squalens]|uniref:Uncharacterized protein n=1 Tax=Dichomitus squalens TaxID=114155 RepID=A0A4Q9PNP3_9APHY|nr:hypothetical protein BD310DRAFT_652146 [Dichomitus squalens]
MFDCNTYSTGTTTTGTARSGPTSCAIGDVCVLRESLAAAVEYIFQATEVIRQDPVALQRSEHALCDLGTLGNIVRASLCGTRALARAPQLSSSWVHSKAYQSNTPAASIPNIYREFCRAIFPNLGLPHSTHFHTTPPWPHSSQWLFSYPVSLGDSNLVVTAHWRFKGQHAYSGSMSCKSVVIVILSSHEPLKASGGRGSRL